MATAGSVDSGVSEITGRHQRIRNKLALFHKLGIITDGYVQSMMPGKRWHIIPFGFSERAYTTSQIEDFILGVETALNWKDHQPSMLEQTR